MTLTSLSLRMNVTSYPGVALAGLYTHFFVQNGPKLLDLHGLGPRGQNLKPFQNSSKYYST